jgi:hypothetical protein
MQFGFVETIYGGEKPGLQFGDRNIAKFNGPTGMVSYFYYSI